MCLMLKDKTQCKISTNISQVIIKTFHLKFQNSKLFNRKAPYLPDKILMFSSVLFCYCYFIILLFGLYIDLNSPFNICLKLNEKYVLTFSWGMLFQRHSSIKSIKSLNHHFAPCFRCEWGVILACNKNK